MGAEEVGPEAAPGVLVVQTARRVASVTVTISFSSFVARETGLLNWR